MHCNINATSLAERSLFRFGWRGGAGENRDDPNPDYSQGTARCAPTEGIVPIVGARRAVPVFDIAMSKKHSTFMLNRYLIIISLNYIDF